MSLPRIDLITINFNSAEHLPGYFQALRGLEYGGDWRVILVDNASTDGSLERVSQWSAGLPVEVLALAANGGFTGGNNAGIRHGDSPYVALLNPDTAVRPDWLTVMVERMEQETDIGYLESRQVPAELSKYHDAATGDTSWGSAGGALLRRSALEQVGLFEDRLFMYEEDVDLCWRLWLGGWRCVYESRAAFAHRPHDRRPMTPFLWYYTRRNHGFMRYIYGSPAACWGYLRHVMFQAARSRRTDLVAPTCRILRDTVAALPWMRERRSAVAGDSPWVGLFESPYRPAGHRTSHA